MARFTYIPNRVIDTNGISDGASIYFYATGTTTPITIYSDAALTTPIANPVVVAAGAAVPAVYYANATIRVRVVDSGGNVVSDDDPYNYLLFNSDLSATTGAALVGTSTGETAEEILGYEPRTRNYWEGLGWLTPFRKRIFDGNGSNIVLSGDSTTVGTNVGANYKPDVLMADLAKQFGAYYQVFFNRGQSGQDTTSWLSTYLAGDITNGGSTPHLFIPRWGANDPAVSGNTIAQCIANWTSAIDTFRASLSLTACPILIMTPGPMADTPNGRDDDWFAELANELRALARTKNCAFFDSFNFLRDVDGLAGTVYDDPYADGREIHPSEAAISMFYYEVASKLFGGLGASQKNNFWNLGDIDRTVAKADLPATFDYGIFIDRAETGDGWTRNGYVATIRPVDGTAALQFNWGFADADPTVIMRVGQGGSWLADQTLGSTAASSNITPGSGYQAPGSEIARANLSSDGFVMTDGYIEPTGAPATLTAGQTVGTIPSGYRPAVTQWGIDLHIYNNGSSPTFETIKGAIATDGTVTTRTASTYAAQRIYFDAEYKAA